MFSLFKRGRSARPDSFPNRSDAPMRLDEARLAAWAKALGQTRPTADPPPLRRPHRGQLPDVDWSNAVPMARRRTLLRMIAGALAARLVPIAVTGDAAPPVPTGPGEDTAPDRMARQDNRRPQPALRRAA